MSETIMPMSPEVNHRDRFIVAACVPRDAHGSGTLEEAEAIVASQPEVAMDDIYAAAVLGDCGEVTRLLAGDALRATAPGRPYGWDALTYLCFSRYLRVGGSIGFVGAARALLDAGADPNTGRSTIQAARALRPQQGRHGLYFSGQYTTGFDSQESAVYSAMKVAESLAPGNQNLASLKAPLAGARTRWHLLRPLIFCRCTSGVCDDSTTEPARPALALQRCACRGRSGPRS
jgi:hypothetical protein